ncbi:MAG: xanthine dehydrogenase family protein molybdopterin-binding subunit [Actinomycetota bacterium]
MPATIGQSVKRLEDGDLVRGTAAYVADIHLPGQVTAFVVRCPVAHGTITHIDVSEALRSPGVIAIYTAEDIRADLGSVPVIQPRVSLDEAVVPFLQPVLAREHVRYVGEPLALVIAADRYAAEDAGDLVFADIDLLPTVIDMEEAAGSEPLFPEGNEVTVLRAGFGDLDAVFREAPIVLEREFKIGRHSGVPLETRGLLVEFDRSTGGLVVHGSTKVPHWNRGQLSAHLGIPAGRIRMKEASVGGGFGVRGEYYPEDFLIAWAALKLERTVGWIEDRREHFISANHSREQSHKAAIAGDAEGRILGIRSEFWCDMGGYVRTHGIRVPDLTMSMLPGPYDLAAYEGVAHCVVTNKTPTGTYRAPGRFESCFVRERLIDAYAAAAGIDPVEVRRRNLIRSDQIPYRRELQSTGEPVTLNEGDYPKMLEKVVERLDVSSVASRRSSGEHVGVGVAMFLEKSGLGPWETGGAEIDREGTIRIWSGCSSVGQGLRTVLAQVAADVFDVDHDAIEVELLDTDRSTEGTGSYASRSTATGGSAVYLAATRVVEQAKAFASEELEVSVGDLEVRDGRVSILGSPDRGLSYGEIAARLTPEGAAAGGMDSGLHAAEYFNVEKLTYPYGCHAAVVRIDPETGAVTVERLVLGYDVGRAVNPMLVEGQLHGAALQGFAGALFESFRYDGEGNPLVTSFMDYLMPTAAEAPYMEAIVSEDAPTRTNPLGVKGAGEGGLTGVAAAIAAAVDDALQRPGTVTSLPVDPEILTNS